MIKTQLPNPTLEETIFAVIDVETTGLSAKSNRVIEIGIVKVRDLKIVDRFESLINPGTSIPFFITQLTDISDKDVFDAPYFDEILEELKEFVDDSIICGHNFSFDSSFLKYEFMRNGSEPLYNEQLCTMKLARRMFPALRSKSLSSVTNHLKLRNTSAHRALSDAEVTARALIKMIKLLKRDSKIETINELLRYQSSAITSRNTRVKESLKEDVSSVPNAPGIYYFLNSRGKIIYVGKAKSLRDRIRSYFAPTAPKKAKRIITQARRLKIEITNTELTALLIEAEAIKKSSPKHNYQLKKYGHKHFLKVTRNHISPRLEISNRFDFDGNDYFGLFISRKKAETVLEIIDKTFQLRECTDKEFSKHKKCFLAEIDRCTAPCVAGNPVEYDEELLRVYEFLFGKNQIALNRMLNKMKEYAEKEKYEKAAEVKEVIDMILAQTHKSSLLAEPVNNANVLFEVSGSFEKDYILLIAGKIYIRNSKLVGTNNFNDALENYYENVIINDYMPTEEDLEKLKISLNWLIKNRNNVRIFYLKEYSSKEELLLNMSSFSRSGHFQNESSFDIQELATA
jgi:DNA polymerase III subunit epsilon